jgi:hypothetical protein
MSSGSTSQSSRTIRFDGEVFEISGENVITHAEMLAHENTRRLLNRMRVRRNIERRRMMYATQANSRKFASLCNCWSMGPRYSWVVQDIIEGLETGEAEKLQLWENYVKLVEQYETDARRASWWLYHLQALRTTFNIILPAILALQNVGSLTVMIMWLTWALSLTVSLATGYLDLFRLREMYEMMTRAHEYLKLEGWQFFALIGKYKEFDSHDKALNAFLLRIAKLKKRMLDHQFPPQKVMNSQDSSAWQGGGGGVVQDKAAASVVPANFVPTTTTTANSEAILNRRLPSEFEDSTGASPVLRQTPPVAIAQPTGFAKRFGPEPGTGGGGDSTRAASSLSAPATPPSLSIRSQRTFKAYPIASFKPMSAVVVEPSLEDKDAAGGQHAESRMTTPLTVRELRHAGFFTGLQTAQENTIMREEDDNDEFKKKTPQQQDEPQQDYRSSPLTNLNLALHNSSSSSSSAPSSPPQREGILSIMQPIPPRKDSDLDTQSTNETRIV